MRWWGRILAVAVVLVAGMGNAQAPGQKLALVIGVSEYGRERAVQEAAGFIVPPALANAVRDSELVASALESKGFTVTRVTNPDKRALLSAMNTFATTLNRAGPDAVGVFYFAGHGAQGRPALERDIDNYLIPLGADLATEVDLESEALALSRVSAALKPGPQGAVVLILDACRDFALPAASRSGLVTRGLAEARAAPGTYIAYATAPGFTALDALPGQQNGPYATALSAELRAAQGSNIEQVFIAVRNKVLEQTRNTQVPWENSSLRRSVVLGVAPVSSDMDTRPAPQAPTIRGREFRDCDICPLMVVLPPGRFSMGSPDAELGHMADEALRTVHIPHPFAVAKFEVSFEEWDACASTGGCRDMNGEPYRPRENTLEDSQTAGRGRQPVVNVSWNDAQLYVGWLNQRVGGKAYRLLSREQWEYAARAGANTPFWTGATINSNQAQFDHSFRYDPRAYQEALDHNAKYEASCEDRPEDLGCGGGLAFGVTRGQVPTGVRSTLAPVKVGSFRANAFGLHDVHGNVAEWLSDRSPYQAQPSRLVCGGGFRDQPVNLRSASCKGQLQSETDDGTGFRVARQVP